MSEPLPSGHSGIMLAVTTVTAAGTSLLAGTEYLGGVAALLVVGASARSGYRKTLGRRRERYRRLARLGTGAHLSFFVSVLGEPPAIRHTIRKTDSRTYVSSDDPRFDPALAGPDASGHQIVETRVYTESVFVDRDYYVQTISDDDDTVLAFSVTTRTRRFHPVYRMPVPPSRIERKRLKREFGYRYVPLLRVTLGRSRFADGDSKDPDHTSGSNSEHTTGPTRSSARSAIPATTRPSCSLRATSLLVLRSGNFTTCNGRSADMSGQTRTQRNTWRSPRGRRCLRRKSSAEKR